MCLCVLYRQHLLQQAVIQDRIHIKNLKLQEQCATNRRCTIHSKRVSINMLRTNFLQIESEQTYLPTSLGQSIQVGHFTQKLVNTWGLTHSAGRISKPHTNTIKIGYKKNTLQFSCIKNRLVGGEIANEKATLCLRESARVSETQEEMAGCRQENGEIQLWLGHEYKTHQVTPFQFLNIQERIFLFCVLPYHAFRLGSDQFLYSTTVELTYSIWTFSQSRILIFYNIGTE